MWGNSGALINAIVQCRGKDQLDPNSNTYDPFEKSKKACQPSGHVSVLRHCHGIHGTLCVRFQPVENFSRKKQSNKYCWKLLTNDITDSSSRVGSKKPRGRMQLITADTNICTISENQACLEGSENVTSRQKSELECYKATNRIALKGNRIALL